MVHADLAVLSLARSPAGTYNAMLGVGEAAGCTPCPLASYCPEGSSAPSPCADVIEAGTTTEPGAM